MWKKVFKTKKVVILTMWKTLIIKYKKIFDKQVKYIYNVKSNGKNIIIQEVCYEKNLSTK